MGKKAVFLDRDGVINELCYHDDKGIYSAMALEEFRVLPKVKEAIKQLKDEGYLIIVVSNQPGVAFGYLKKEEVEKINQFLKTELGVDGIYNCFHHPEFTGECDCRKPKEGMLLQAAKDFGIDIASSYLVGDNLSDIQAGGRCKKRILIGVKNLDMYRIIESKDIHPDHIVMNLFEAVDHILDGVKVVIVAGGLAKRLKPITEEIPKCMIDVGGKPLIEHQIEIFKKQGFTDFIFCIAHLKEKVKEYFGDGEKFGIKINYSEEKELLGTAGAVKLVESYLKEPFIVFFGDIITNLDFQRMVDTHKQKQAILTIAAHPRPKKHDFTSFIDADSDWVIKEFIEQPERTIIENYSSDELFVNSSIYILEPEVLEFIPLKTKFDFGYDLFPLLIKQNKKLVLYPHDNECYKEIGTF